MCNTDSPLKPLPHIHAFRHHQEVLQSILDKEDVAQNEQFFLFHIPIYFLFFYFLSIKFSALSENVTFVRSVTYVSLEKSEISYKANDSLT